MVTQCVRVHVSQLVSICNWVETNDVQLLLCFFTMSAVVSMNLAFLGIHANSEGCLGNSLALFVVSSQSMSYISLMDSFFLSRAWIGELSCGSCSDMCVCFVIWPFDSCVTFALEYVLSFPSSLTVFRASSCKCDNGIASPLYHVLASYMGCAFLRLVSLGTEVGNLCMEIF